MVQWDIDMELEQLIEKYNLDRHYLAYRTSRRACDFMCKWVKQLAESSGSLGIYKKGEEILVFGNG